MNRAEFWAWRCGARLVSASCRSGSPRCFRALWEIDDLPSREVCAVLKISDANSLGNATPRPDGAAAVSGDKLFLRARFHHQEAMTGVVSEFLRKDRPSSCDLHDRMTPVPCHVKAASALLLDEWNARAMFTCHDMTPAYLASFRTAVSPLDDALEDEAALPPLPLVPLPLPPPAWAIAPRIHPAPGARPRRARGNAPI